MLPETIRSVERIISQTTLLQAHYAYSINKGLSSTIPEFAEYSKFEAGSLQVCTVLQWEFEAK